MSFAVIAHPDTYRTGGLNDFASPNEYGYLAVCPPDDKPPKTLEIGPECTARIVVTGANLDATTFEGKFRVVGKHLNPGVPALTHHVFEWTAAPKLV